MTLSTPTEQRTGPDERAAARPARRGRGTGSGRARLAVEALAVGVVGAAALILIARFALGTLVGQRLDRDAMRAVSGPDGTLLRVHELLSTISVGAVALVLCACVVLALLRRRLAVALAVIVLVGGANVSTQLLKHDLLVRTDFGLGTLNGLPSGHTTVVVSLVLAAVLAAPRAWRIPVTLLGACAATLVGVGTVVARWHHPSDVVAAIAVCVVWTAIALLLVAALRRRIPRAGRGGGFGLALLGAIVGGIIVVYVGIRPTMGSLDLVAAALSAIGVACAAAVGWTAHAARRFLD